MTFGRLQIATLWRLSKSDVSCDALVVDGERALRLIVVEGGRIVQWERFPTAASLRRRAVAILKQRRRKGWRVADEGRSIRPRRDDDTAGDPSLPAARGPASGT